MHTDRGAVEPGAEVAVPDDLVEHHPQRQGEAEGHTVAEDGL